MAEMSAAPAASGDPELSFTVNVGKARYLMSVKKPSEAPTTFARVQVGKEVFESDQMANTTLPDYKFNKTVTKTLNQEFISDLVTHGVSVTIVEVAGTEKIPIAFAKLDITNAVLEAQTEFSECVLLQPRAGQTFDDPRPDVQLSLMLSAPLVSSADAESTNLLTIEAGSGLFSLPPKWLLADSEAPATHPFTYVLDLSLPGAEGAPPLLSLSLTGGELTRPTPGQPPVPGADEQQQAAELQQRVQWPSDVSVLLTPATAAALKAAVAGGSGLALSLRRVLKSEAVPDVNERKYRGQGTATLEPLLVVDVTAAVGRFPIVPMPVAEEAPAGGKKPAKPPAAKPPPKGSHPLLFPEPDEEPHPYVAAKTYVRLAFRTARPLNPAPKQPRVVKRPRDLIKARPRIPRHLQPIAPTDELHEQVTAAVLHVIDFYRGKYGDLSDVSGEMLDTRRAEVEQELSDSGALHALTERLRHTVARIAREKFLSTAGGDPRELDRLRGELFVYVMQQAHAALSRIFDTPIDPFMATPNPDGEDAVMAALRLAHEAESNDEPAAASIHYQDAIALDKGNPSVWHEYGMFNLRQRQLSKADECFREAIALDAEARPTLLAYGTVLAERDNYAEAEVFLSAAAKTADAGALEHAVLAVLYDVMNMEKESRAALRDAGQIARARGTGGALRIHAARCFLDCGATKLAERALAQEVVAAGKSVEVLVLTGRMYALRDDVARAEESLLEAVSMNPRWADSWIALGNLRYERQQWPEAQKAYEAAVKLTPGTMPHDQALLRLGKLALQSQRYEAAREAYMNACEARPTASGWVGVARACLAMDELSDAEDALSEANILNPRNALVWALLCDISLRQERLEDATTALQQTLALRCTDIPVLRGIAERYARLGQHRTAEGVYRRALAECTDALSRARLQAALGSVLVEVRETREAADVLRQAVTSGVLQGNELREAAQQLRTVLYGLNEIVEAEKYSSLL